MSEKIMSIPSNVEAEEVVLCAMLMDTKTVVDDNELFSELGDNDFYDQRNAAVFRAARRVHDGLNPINLMTVTKELERTGETGKAGGADHVASLTNKIYSAANIGYYIKQVREYSLRRKYMKAGLEITADAQDTGKDIGAIRSESEKKILGIGDGLSGTEIHGPMEIAMGVTKEIEARHNAKDSLGIKSGLAYLDAKTGGFRNSELTVVGARPGCGKTALALTSVNNVAIKDEGGTAAAIFSLEMGVTALGIRLLSQTESIPGSVLRSGMLTSADMESVVRGCDTISRKSIYIVDKPGISLDEIVTKSRVLVKKNGVRIIFIDYIGLIPMPAASRMQVWEYTSMITLALKALARELDVPVVALCQLGRPAQDRRPTLADLRGSGSVEQDADVVLLLHADESDDSQDKRKVSLIIAKNRNGETGSADLAFYPKYTLFEDWQEEAL